MATVNEETIANFAATKPIESRLYLILFYNAQDEVDTFITAYGRLEAYKSIRDICLRELSDPKDVVVLVEYIVKDRNTDELKWSIMHPDIAKNGFQFCKAVENHIPEEERFAIEDYTEDREGEEEEFNPGPNSKPSQVSKLSMADITELNNLGTLEGGDMVSTDDYLAMINNRNQNLFVAPDEDAFEGIRPEYNPFV